MVWCARIYALIIFNGPIIKSVVDFVTRKMYTNVLYARIDNWPSTQWRSQVTAVWAYVVGAPTAKELYEVNIIWNNWPVYSSRVIPFKIFPFLYSDINHLLQIYILSSDIHSYTGSSYFLKYMHAVHAYKHTTLEDLNKPTFFIWFLI